MHAGKKTKIIATIGPASDSVEIIEELIKTGVNVFRFNMKHNSKEWHSERIERVQKVAQRLNIPVGVLIDLQGPEIRIITEKEQPISISKNDLIFFAKDFAVKDKYQIPYPAIVVPIPSIIDSMDKEDEFSIDDGFFEFSIEEKLPEGFIAKCHDAGIIKTHKSLNLIGKDVDLPSLTNDDLEKLDIGAKSKVDFIALSFVRTKDDIDTLRNEMNKRNLKARIVAKVESEKGVDNIDEIIDHTDVVMIARGDLGVEMPIERIAFIQKQMIKKCRSKNKQVIVATQMLQSMTESSRPTRAEATDVANAVYDGADAVMLSAESATGNYPIKAVEIMKRILKYNENHTNLCEDFKPENKDQTNAIVSASISLLEKKLININKVVIFTETGYTAHVFSSFRSKIPVLVVSANKEVAESLTLDYGLFSVYATLPAGQFSFNDMDSYLIEKGYVNKGETVLVIHGNRWRDPGKTNALVVLEV
jgi:pyruvate kinase